MKLWDKGIATAELVHRFTVGNDREMDKRLAPFDIQGTIAHVTMLSECGLFPKSELIKVVNELTNLLHVVQSEDFSIPENVEDIHSWVEIQLTEKLGDMGKMVHTARSRNDQVLVDIHLYLKSVLQNFQTETVAFGNELCNLAEKFEAVRLPGYTHTQVAMPSSFGMWLSAYGECLSDDLSLLKAAYQCADQNPLGTAAGYGSAFPIDRAKTTELLGFSQLKVNPVAAQLNRGKLEQTVCFALTSLSGTMGKLSSDCVLFLCQNFAFISFPDELTTGSSIMPHKKNPDVFELIRAKCNQVSTLSFEVAALSRNLTSGYHRDFQLLKEPLFRAIDLTTDCLQMIRYMMSQLQVSKDLMENQLYSSVYSVDAIKTLVDSGVPFREAYIKVGKEIEAGLVLECSGETTTHIGSLNNLGIDLIREKLNNVF